jgi:hypothetical protein
MITRRSIADAVFAYFSPDEGAGGAGGGDAGGQGGGTPAASGGAAPAENAPAAGAGAADDWKAKYEAAEAERKRLADDEQKRKDAELTESQREKKRADTAEAEAKAARTELLKVKIGGELGIPAEALEFITATDEAGIRAQAEKLKGFVKAPTAGGTVTNPAGGQQPSLDQQIAEAEKSGNALLAIQFKRQQAFGGKS